MEPPRGPVEAEFLRPILLGESIAPYRLLNMALGVVPVTAETILDARAALDAGYRQLAGWLRAVEGKWTTHCSKRSDGLPEMTLKERLDRMHGLSDQLGTAGIKLVYTKAGTLLSTGILDDTTVIIENGAYWAAARSIEEARYLIAVLNSGYALQRIIPMQPRGWRDPRHFDNLIWELPIAEYDRRQSLHTELAAAAARAERLAAMVQLDETWYFMRQRRAIREALAADGIAAVIDALVARLLGGS